MSTCLRTNTRYVRRGIRGVLSHLLMAVGLVLLTGSCGKEGGGKQVHQPASRGLPYELAMIIPQSLYTGELRDTLDAVLRASTPVLPQHEPLFRVDVVYAEGNLTPWRTMRNRLLLEVHRSVQTPRMGVARNPVAVPQIEVKVEASTAHELSVFLSQNKERVQELFVEAELTKEAANLRRKHSQRTLEELRALCGHTICVPAGLKASKTGEDFLWTGTNLNDKDQNFIFYAYAWDGRPLSAERYVSVRDSVLRENVPGARQGQWMQTARLDGKPLMISRARTINNNNVLEVHGLWELKDGALGGPFVALERVDTAAGRVLVTEGFVYSPHSPKRDILRQMEAALRTFQ